MKSGNYARAGIITYNCQAAPIDKVVKGENLISSIAQTYHSGNSRHQNFNSSLNDVNYFRIQRLKLTQERGTEAQTEVKGHLDGKTNLVSGLERNVLNSRRQIIRQLVLMPHNDIACVVWECKQ